MGKVLQSELKTYATFSGPLTSCRGCIRGLGAEHQKHCRVPLQTSLEKLSKKFYGWHLLELAINKLLGIYDWLRSWRIYRIEDDHPY